MSIFHNNVLAGASGATGASAFQIDRSLRFNDDDSAYLSRTPSSAGNRKTWTLSFWVKKHRNGGNPQQIFGQYRADTPEAQNRFQLYFDGSTDKLEIHTFSLTHLKTDRIFRDNSAWYHIVLAVDTTLSTADNRMRLYVNGAEETNFTTRNNPSQNLDLGINTDGEINIGTAPNAKSTYYADVNLAEINFVEGSQLAASDFGEYDSDNNWNPKAYSGTYGTNGFHLDFSDNSSNSALGDDSSGNNNDWTVNNLSVDDGTGAVYTDDLAASGSLYSGTSLSNAFDGNTGTTAQMTNATQNQTLTFTPTGGIAYSSSVEVFLYPTGNVAVTRYSVNGGSDQSFSSGDGYKTILSGSGTLTSFVLKQGAQSNSVGFSAIRIDGSTILIDSNGANNDSLIDTPTNYDADSGNNGGNYATLNPLSKGSAITLANGNLDISAASSGSQRVWGTIGVSTGKWYFEFTQSSGTYAQAVGIKSSAAQDNSTQYAYHGNTGNKIDASGSTSSYGATWGNDDVIGVAFDLDAGTITFYKNGASQGQAFSGITDATYFPYVVGWSGGAWGGFVNFGQRPFAYTPPTGFKSLCTQNLTDPTIADGSTAMDIALYNGNGGTQSVSGLNLAPDWVWIKNRNGAHNHMLFDIVRGAGADLQSNSTATEGSAGSNDLTSFDSNGFSLGSNNAVNQSGRTYVGWAWDAGTTTATNTDGSITSNVRANASAGFSVLTYSGNSTSGATIGHGLNAAPEFIVVKARNTTQGWCVYHASLGATKYIQLDTTAAATSYSGTWNNTSPTSSVFSVGNDNIVNTSYNYVAYCFAPVAGYSAFGSYTGNGSSDGTFVHTGFRVAWLMTKRTDTAENWEVRDSSRNPHNRTNLTLFPHSNSAEDSGSVDFDLLSNGFKLRNTNGSTNANGGTYIYAAFAEHPFKTARAR